MTAMKTNLPTSCVLLGLIFLGTSSEARGAPGRWYLEKSTDPILVEARKADLNFVGPEKGNQATAEELYLRFISQHPTDPLVFYIYYHLGHMYSGWVDPRWQKKYGHVRDDARARRFFLEAVKHHPSEKTSDTLTRARVSAASLAPTSEEQVAEYLAVCKSLLAYKQPDELLKALWRTPEQIARTERSDGAKAAFRKQVWENREGMLFVASQNMVAIAEHAQKTKGLPLLDTIIKELPADTLAVKLAKEKKAEITKKKKANGSNSNRAKDAGPQGSRSPGVRPTKA